MDVIIYKLTLTYFDQQISMFYKISKVPTQVLFAGFTPDYSKVLDVLVTGSAFQTTHSIFKCHFCELIHHMF